MTTDASSIIDDRPVLQVNGLTVQFKTEAGPLTAVRDVSLEVRRGETLALVGESGSGKSVTSLAIMRLVENGGGRIINGSVNLLRHDNTVVDLTKLPQHEVNHIRGSDMAMIFQEPMTSLNPVFTVGDQIAESLLLHRGMTKREGQLEAVRLLDLVRIPDARRIAARYPHQLSGGMRQRVMIAMALACKPALLIADEPTTALDVTVQAQILSLIRQLQEEVHMGVLFITHDMGVVAEVADRINVMRYGEVVESNVSSEVFHHPQHPYTKALLAAVPRLGSMRGTTEPHPFVLLDAETGKTITPAIEKTRPPENVILEVKDLVKRFPVKTNWLGQPQAYVHACEHVSFTLRKGETLAIVGESGCGKSTTGRTVLGLLHPDSGQVLFEGQDITNARGQKLHELRRQMQMIFQDPFASLDPRLTVGYSIAEPLLIHSVCSQREAEERVKELLLRVGLSPEMANRYPHEFSGGQRQRICIARALALHPRIIVADECVAALDVSIRAQVVNLMMELQQELGLSYIFISHDMGVVERISHRVAVMFLGQIVEIGSRADVLYNPQHPYTKRLLAAVPVPDPARRKMRRALITGELPSPVHDIRHPPEVVRLHEVSPGHLVADVTEQIS